MNDFDPTEPDPELLASLRADFTNPEREVRARVSDRLAHSVGLLALSSVGATARPSLSSTLRAHSLGFMTSFALGGACGAGLFAALQRPPAPVRVYIDQPSAQITPVASASTQAQSAVAPVPPAAVAVKPAAPASTQRGPAGLAEQQALLDVARSAFGRSDYQQTLQVLSTHLRRYPNSVLTEEREALEIKALAASGRGADAKSRATRFSARFPQSLLLPSISESTKAIP